MNRNANRYRPVLTALVWGCAGVVAVIVISTVLLTRGTQKTNAPKIDNTAETLKLVKDCVTPGGECYRRGQAQTADAVGSISLSQVAAVACADRPGTQSAIELRACVARTLRVFEASHEDKP